MVKKRYTPEAIIRKLREAEVLQAKAKPSPRWSSNWASPSRSSTANAPEFPGWSARAAKR